MSFDVPSVKKTIFFTFLMYSLSVVSVYKHTLHCTIWFQNLPLSTYSLLAMCGASTEGNIIHLWECINNLMTCRREFVIKNKRRAPTSSQWIRVKSTFKFERKWAEISSLTESSLFIVWCYSNIIFSWYRKCKFHFR